MDQGCCPATTAAVCVPTIGRVLCYSTDRRIMQLVEDELIDHEVMSVIIRRYCQSDQEADKHSPYLTWRHPIEPEFSTLVLSDHDFLHTVSIQKALCADSLKYDITSAQLFFTPVPRPKGWIVVFWDMVARLMFVIDPMYSKRSQPLTTQQRDEITAWKLHDALFICLNEYYAGWPVRKDGWKVTFPALADSIFSRNETGACVVHIARHCDGKKLKMPLTKGFRRCAFSGRRRSRRRRGVYVDFINFKMICRLSLSKVLIGVRCACVCL
ncbi:uncharacterized protein LOC119302535 isoform X2 [Triticum dicoccoides]|uniref:uncharacterized protein LOC119302535 isoform X2 n=1 Tax=Triticum dicoccoides TaxID=85692 RepID=UPI00188EF86B|nr:uncharacterized protein LOC119302535 isoform X2 [Triticum dicoccoides]